MRVTKKMLKEAGVTVLTKLYLKSVTKEGPRIKSLTTKNGTFAARVFIDGTYEGDLMAAAGVDQTVPIRRGKHFRSIGTVDLEAGTETVIQITNTGTVGFVILDALQLLSINAKSK